MHKLDYVRSNYLPPPFLVFLNYNGLLPVVVEHENRLLNAHIKVTMTAVEERFPSLLRCLTNISLVL